MAVDSTARGMAASALASLGGGGTMTNPMTNAGDMIVGGASGAPQRLALGVGVQSALGSAINASGGFVGFSGALGTPSSGTLTNCSGLPISGLASLGTNVGTALGNALNGAGGIVGFSGALGTPASGTLTNCSGLLATGYVTMVGDSGSGGTKGAVPAPATGDAAAGKFLKADGTWAVPASGGTPGGSNTQLQYNNSGSFGGAAALTYAASGNNLTVTAQNTTDVPLLVKGAASQSGNLQEWRASDATLKASLSINGHITVGSNTTPSASNTDLFTVAGGQYGYFSLNGSGAGNVGFALNQGAASGVTNNGFFTIGIVGTHADSIYGLSTLAQTNLTSGDGVILGYVGAWAQYLVFTHDINAVGLGGRDVLLQRDAANTLALRNGTNAQKFNAYYSYTDASNYARAVIDAGAGAANTLTIGTEAAGTGVGTFNKIKFIAEGTNVLDWNISTPSTLTSPIHFAVGGDLKVTATSAVSWQARTALTAPATGNLLLQNTAGTDFGLLQLGGISPLFPALKRFATDIQARLADDSGYTPVDASAYKISGTSVLSGQASGYGTPTGGSHQASFAAGSITLANLAACVAQLIVDLKAGNMPAA